MRNLALGYTLRQIENRPDEQEMKALQRRLRSLKTQAGARTNPHLVYQIFSGYYLWPFTSDIRRPRPREVELEMVQLIAVGHDVRSASRKTHLSESTVRYRLTHAREVTRTNTLAHLVAICWSKDYIV